jgi:hypothetical protein
MKITTCILVVLLAGVSWAALAGEAPKAPVPVSVEDRKKAMDAETPEQKKLREEIKALGGNARHPHWVTPSGTWTK